VCKYLDGKVNLYMRPVWGITVTVDPEEMKIIGFEDRSTMQCRSLTGLTTVD
jgi:primary-amine oxidase